jgi:hypothetical protein
MKQQQDPFKASDVVFCIVADVEIDGEKVKGVPFSRNFKSLKLCRKVGRRIKQSGLLSKPYLMTCGTFHGVQITQGVYRTLRRGHRSKGQKYGFSHPHGQTPAIEYAPLLGTIS